MAEWNLFYAPESIKELNKLDSATKERIREKLEWLVSNFDSINPQSLGGDWSGFFKLRVGDWRAIYDIDWKRRSVFILAIGHRSDIYKKP